MIPRFGLHHLLNGGYNPQFAFGANPMQMQPQPGQQFMFPILQTPATYILPAAFQQAAMFSGGPRALPRRAAPLEKPPVTTAFVGNIHERCSNDLIRSMLQECGNVVSWKRIQGSNGKYKAFGYCEFDHPETTLRALRILINWPLGDKRLVVKVDEKTRNTIIGFIERKRKAMCKPALTLEAEELPCDPEMSKDDHAITRVIEELIKREGPDLVTQTEDGRASCSPTLQGKGGNLDIESLDRERKEYIAREISHFRDTYKEDEKKKEGEKEGQWEPGAKHTPTPHSDTGRQSAAGKRRSTTRSPSRERASRNSRRRSRSASESSVERRTHSRSSSERSQSSRDSRSPSRTPPPRVIRTDRCSEERRKAEKELKEKDEAYKERLKKWEMREKKKSKEYDKRRAAERIKRREELAEAAKLKEFLEDYEDERDDAKFYRGSALFERKRNYEMERQEDLKDQQAEADELNEIKKQLEEQGHTDPQQEVNRMQKMQEEKLLSKLRASHSPSPTGLIAAARGATVTDDVVMESSDSEASTSGQSSKSGSSGSSSSSESDGEGKSPSRKRKRTLNPGDGDKKVEQITIDEDTKEDEAKDSKFLPNSMTAAEGNSEAGKRIGFAGIKLSHHNASSRPSEIFVDESEECLSGCLVPPSALAALDVSHITSQQRKQLIRDMIERIPTDKTQLFAFPIHWNVLDSGLLEKRVKPWVSKKICDYIGEDEPKLVEFVCQKLTTKTEPQTLLNEISQVLDDEADVFVVKLWRLLIYEIEAKRVGLVKSD